jgi:hypothetical protein
VRSAAYLLNVLRREGVLTRAQVRERKRTLRAIQTKAGLPEAA